MNYKTENIMQINVKNPLKLDCGQTICDFSLGKTITCGEGGAILTNSKKIFLKVKEIRDSENLSYNNQNQANLCFRPTNLQAAMIFGQFKRLNDLILNKKRILSRYKKNLSKPNLMLFGLNSILIEFDKKYKLKINTLIAYLKKNNIYVKKIITSNQKFKKSMIILPSNIELKNEQVDLISNKIKLFLKIRL